MNGAGGGGHLAQAEPPRSSTDGRLAHRLFLSIRQFPAMRASWFREIIGGSSSGMARHLGRFVDGGLMAVFDHGYYLWELGMIRAANMGRILPGSVQQHHGADLERFHREHDKRHNDGVNRLVVQFPREGVDAVACWQGEMNLPSEAATPFDQRRAPSLGCWAAAWRHGVRWHQPADRRTAGQGPSHKHRTPVTRLIDTEGTAERHTARTASV